MKNMFGIKASSSEGDKDSITSSSSSNNNKLLSSESMKGASVGERNYNI